ncbi:hypothetical protein BDV93DRAFT_441693 [Ceratobasidium sp. AG-I]|nr:hypothetical protein BDV93DRAFT_441693 [Ceratobasidium sp. AG-I]
MTCIYPSGAIASCSSSNVCNFTCPNGLTKVGSACTCVSPKLMCNGVCTSASCPSPGLKRRDVYLAKTGTVCPAGTERCGVWSGLRQDYECLNTQTDLESCGGCVTPFPGEKATGKDCTEILGVSSVQCSSGQCKVESCLEGWKVDTAGRSCTSLA